MRKIDEVYIDFKNGQGPYISDIQLNQLQKLIKQDIKNQVLESLKLAFPIGHPYVTQDDTNPNLILGFGTWERIKGKVLVGLDEDDEDGYFDEIGKTGGEKEHTLTIDEIPKHTPEATNYNIAGSGIVRVAQGDYANVGNPTGKIVFKEIGGGQSHNNMPPYEVVGYMWIRRA